MAAASTLVRARVIHTPRDPFVNDDSLEAFSDGALVFAEGRIQALGDFATVRDQHPGAELIDARDSHLLPGLVDSHVHWPQLGIIGATGLGLLDWLRERTLPEEARLADDDYARSLAGHFLRALAANGTTTALVFGSHFPGAQESFFEAAERSGLRITSGLVTSDRDLPAELLQTPGAAYEAGRALAGRWHGKGRLRYAVSPRFSVSCSEEMLASCGALGGELDGALITSHVNENEDEVRLVSSRFPSAADYLDTYQRHGLVGPETVLAHNVHAGDAELGRMAEAGAGVAHCPSSNACLGSGIFPMRRHLDERVSFGLGTDVGAGAGVSILGESSSAYQAQMLAPGGLRLSPSRLLWLATQAGASVLGLGAEVGDLTPGKAADFILVRPPAGSTLELLLRHSDSAEEALGALFALAREESVAEVRVAGERVDDSAV